MHFELTTLSARDGRTIEVYVGQNDDDPPLLIHNGTPSSALPFEPTLDVLADLGQRYASFSRPGYGSSSRLPGRSVADVVPDVETVMDHLGAETFYVMGWSGGGPHALATAALLPRRVRGVALIGGVAPYPAAGLDFLAGMGAENIEEFGAAMAGSEELAAWMDQATPALRDVTPQLVADSFGDLIDDVDRASFNADFATYVAASIRAALRTGYWGWFDDDLAFVRDWGFDLAAIRAPVHVWQGGHDRMVPFAHGEWLAANLPTACPHLLPEHGHLSLVVESLPAIVRELLATVHPDGPTLRP
jgi:pimeloyl-ACP methyl ester carboxylesterase